MTAPAAIHATRPFIAPLVKHDGRLERDASAIGNIAFFPRRVFFQGEDQAEFAPLLASRSGRYQFVVWTLHLWQDTKLLGNCLDALSFKPAHGFLCFARFPALTQGGAPNAHEIVRRQPRLLGHQ
jgi:hypothetical protein